MANEIKNYHKLCEKANIEPHLKFYREHVELPLALYLIEDVGEDTALKIAKIIIEYLKD
ncbi:MAG: hypothetical protein LUH21_03850 [Clostridiales bacterium]|nr:hypothetical protein [Clostridiales bacterium]